jgi:hypothetical protein
MNNARSKLGDKLFALARKTYPAGQKGDSARKELGNLLFKMAAAVYPDKKSTAKAKRAVK